MKGIVFTEFLTMVGKTFSEDMVDDIIEDAALPNGGAYTAVGTYPFEDMVSLIVALSTRSGISAPALIHAFGNYLFGRFATLYPMFVDDVPGTLELVASIEKVIHVEVRKLYPDAELPRFAIEKQTENHLHIVYQSPRCLAALAEGLIDGAITHYGETGRVSVRQEPLDDSGKSVRFILDRT